jgi:glycyl-tRNA synthetase
MAEIEHFVDPQDKSHPKFESVQDMTIPLWRASAQEENTPVINDLTLKDAVEKGVIANQTLAYFIARSYLFLISVGINKDAIRYRQHRCNEMAHYAQDCWDAEVETSYGWIEIAGHADRSCYDLSRHAEVTNVELIAARMLKEPMKVDFIHITVDKKKIGMTYKKDSKEINTMIEKWTDDEKKSFYE